MEQDDSDDAAKEPEVELEVVRTLDLASLPDAPHQPDAKAIPYQRLANKNLHFQNKWFTEFPWLHYDAGMESVFCYQCCKAKNDNLVHISTQFDGAFIRNGFKNWKKANEKFRKHETSHFHRLAVSNLIFTQTQQPVNAQLDKQVASEQQSAQEVLVNIITSLMYLAEQGLALRGHTELTGNFKKLLQLRADDDDKLKRWLRKTTNYTSPAAQNEFLGIMSNTILKDVCNEINSESEQF